MAQNTENAILSAAEYTENETNNTMKTVQRLPKPKFRKHPILSPMNSGEHSTRDYESDSDMLGLQERVQEDESSDDNSNDEQYRIMPALVISERNRSDSSCNKDSEDDTNSDDDEWNLLKSNSHQQDTTHHKFKPARQPTDSSRNFGDNDSNEYPDDSGSEDDIPKLTERYNEDRETRKEPDKYPNLAPRKPPDN